MRGIDKNAYQKLFYTIIGLIEINVVIRTSRLEMNPNNISKTMPGKLIKETSGEGDYWAYTPDPLPPKINLDNIIYLLNSEADRAIGGLNYPLTNVPDPYYYLMLHREAFCSSKNEEAITTIP